MQNTDHLTALHTRLLNETARLDKAKSKNERIMRSTIVDGIKKEIAAEMEFLGISTSLPDISDDELLDELLKELGY